MPIEYLTLGKFRYYANKRSIESYADAIIYSCDVSTHKSCTLQTQVDCSHVFHKVSTVQHLCTPFQVIFSQLEQSFVASLP